MWTNTVNSLYDSKNKVGRQVPQLQKRSCKMYRNNVGSRGGLWIRQAPVLAAHTLLQCSRWTDWCVVFYFLSRWRPSQLRHYTICCTDLSFPSAIIWKTSHLIKTLMVYSGNSRKLVWAKGEGWWRGRRSSWGGVTKSFTQVVSYLTEYYRFSKCFFYTF